MMVSMEEFYVKAGELVKTEQVEQGNAPTRTFSVVFTYERGQAAYDGKSWHRQLDQQREVA